MRSVMLLVPSIRDAGLTPFTFPMSGEELLDLASQIRADMPMPDVIYVGIEGDTSKRFVLLAQAIDFLCSK